MTIDLSNRTSYMGWRPQLPDVRDFQFNHTAALNRLGLVVPPDIIDPRDYWKQKVIDQSRLGCCVGNATSNAIRYEFEKQNLPVWLPSRLMTYYGARQMENTVDSDAGCEIRDAIKFIANTGVCPESEWEYDITKFAVKPPDSCYTDAAKHLALRYEAVSQDSLALRTALISGPVVVGFTVYNNINNPLTSGPEGYLPLPGPNDTVEGGHCLAGNTIIPLLDGRKISIKELAEQFNDKSFWVYSCDDQGNIVPGLAHHPRKVKNAETLNVALDNGEVIYCTKDHPFLMRNGSYTLSADLVPGDSLMPLYRKLSDDDKMPGYEQLLNPNTNNWIYTHRLVASNYYKKNLKNLVVHHEDFCKLNNDPNNLKIMTWEEHTALHSTFSRLLSDYAKSDVGRQKSKELMLALWENDEWRFKMLSQVVDRARLGGLTTVTNGTNWFQSTEGRAFSSSLGKRCGKENIKKALTPEAKAKSVKSRTDHLKNDPEFAEKIRKTARDNLKLYNDSVANGTTVPTERQKNSRRMSGHRLSYNRFFKDSFDSFEDYLASKELVNHKVVSVSPGDNEDVYDLTVDKYNNFALESGVFVHNCVLLIGYDWVNKYPGQSEHVWILLNSWGDWANGGTFSMPEEYLTNPNLASDFWSITLME